MNVLIMEFDTEADIREAAEYLWNKAGVTGELNIKPIGRDAWRLELVSENSIRQSVIDKLKGRRVE